MYKGSSTWDKEQEDDDFIIHKDKQHGADYHKQADYASGGSTSSDVYNSQKAKDENEKKEATGIEKDVEKEIKKYDKKEASEEAIRIKAASDIHSSSSSLRDDKAEKDKKAHKSIEEAIEKAIKEEKEVIHIKD